MPLTNQSYLNRKKELLVIVHIYYLFVSDRMFTSIHIQIDLFERRSSDQQCFMIKRDFKRFQLKKINKNLNYGHRLIITLNRQLTFKL